MILRVKVLCVIFILFLSTNAWSQSNEFLITGRFKVDGGSNNGATISLEKDGRKVKSLPGDGRFEIGLDYQAIYIISFEKEGFVTKKLRFDTHVPEDRIEYGFVPFDFTIEIFEQFDDVNTVMFNQPVGKIAFSDIIDEFDYDTDYTQSIQAKMEEVMEEVEEKKEEKARKIEEEAKKNEELNKQVENLTSGADKSLKSGDPEEAIKQLEEAAKLKDSPEIQQKIEEANKALEEKKKQQEAEEKLNAIVEEAEAKMESGNLEEAKGLLDEANKIAEENPKVKSLMADIEKAQKEQAAKEEEYNDLIAEAKEAMATGNPEVAVEKAQEAKKIKATPDAENLISQAQEAAEQAAAEAEAQAELAETIEGLLADADELADAKDFKTAIAKLEEANTLKASPELQSQIERLKAQQAEAIAEAEAEAAKAAQAEDLGGQIAQALGENDAKAARTALAELEAIDPDAAKEYSKQVENLEKTIADEQAEKEKQDAEFNDLLAEANKKLDAGELDEAKEIIAEALEIKPEDAAAVGLRDQVNEALEAQVAEAEKAKAEEEAKAAEFEAKIKEAETALASGDFDKARDSYTKAGEIKDDKRVEEGILAVDEAEKAAANAMAEEEAAAKEAEFESLISKAETALANSDFEAARETYRQAAAIKEDKRIEQGLKSVDEAEAAMAEEAANQAAEAAEKEKKEEFENLLANAQGALESGDLDAARDGYNKAGELFEDKRVKEGLKAVEEAEKQLAESEKNQAEQLEREAREKAAAEEEARKAEEEAAKAMANEAEEANQLEFENLLSDADNALANGDLAKAREGYTKAGELFEDKRVKNGLKAVEKAELEATENELALEEQRKKEEAERAEAERLAAEEAEAKVAEEESIAAEKERLALEEEQRRKEQESADEEAARQAEIEQKAIKEAEIATQIQNAISNGDALFQAGKLKGAKDEYEKAKSLGAGAEVNKKIAQIQDILEKQEEERIKAKEAAQAIANGPRESNQLADIIDEESMKQEVRSGTESPDIDSKPKNSSVAQAVMEVDEKPAYVAPGGAVIMSETKVGEAAMATPAAQLSEDDKFDGVMNQIEAQDIQMAQEQEQRRLKEKYPRRKTVETEKAGTSTITYVYINRGDFVNVYKKVIHNWGGEFYFIDERPTNKRFWEHETQ